MRFVKYVGGSAPSSRWDVAVDFEILQDEGEDEGEDEGVDEGVTEGGKK